MNKPTLQDVLKMYADRQFKPFGFTGPTKNYNLNIFGIRTKSRHAGLFDDWIGVFWYDEDEGRMQYHVWPATTDPGAYWLHYPMKVEGTAILVAGQHKGSHKFGYHKNRYPALVQNRPLPVYRDNNKDEILDMDPFTINTGVYGINIHRASSEHESAVVDKWSAGCQVFANPKDFDEFMVIVSRAAMIWGNVFTYTLLEE